MPIKIVLTIYNSSIALLVYNNNICTTSDWIADVHWCSVNLILILSKANLKCWDKRPKWMLQSKQVETQFGEGFVVGALNYLLGFCWFLGCPDLTLQFL